MQPWLKTALLRELRPATGRRCSRCSFLLPGFLIELRLVFDDLALQRDGLGIVDVVTREPDLEDVFLSLVRR